VGFEVLPPLVYETWPRVGPIAPGPGLDRTGDCDRGTTARDQAEDPPSEHPGETEDPDRDRVGALEVVEQPAVEVEIGERALDAVDAIVCEQGAGPPKSSLGYCVSIKRALSLPLRSTIIQLRVANK